MTRRHLLRSCCCTAALAFASSVHAQTSPSEAQNATQSNTSRADGQPVPGTAPPAAVTHRGRAVNEAEIIVTGQRRVALPVDVVPVTVFSAETRNLISAGTANELVNLTPNFTYTDGFGLNVRGVGRQTPQSLLGQENTVLQYVDGFVQLSPTDIAESTLFGGNVQFDPGPQGTRYGRNALAGAVNVITRAPTDTPHGEADFGVGRGGAFNIGANVSGPITDKLGIRIGAQTFNNPTLSNNIGSSRNAGFAFDNAYFELQLQYRSGPFHIRTRTTHFSFTNRPGYTSPLAYDTTTVFGGLAPNPGYHYGVPSPQQPFTINVDDKGYDHLRDNFQQTVNADYDLGSVSLVYIGGYQQFHSSGQSDLDLTSRASYVAAPTDPFAPGTVVQTRQLQGYDSRDNFWSQELRLESKNKGPFRWVIGGYYFNQDFNEAYNQFIPDADAVLTTPTVGTSAVPAAPNPGRSIFAQRNLFKVQSEAGFGNFTYAFTPKLELDAGVRYTFDHKDAVTNFRYVFYYPPFFAGDFSPAVHGATPDRSDQGLSGHGALTFRPSTSASLYVSASHGYQSSAFTLGQGLAPRNIAAPEYLDVYEGGGTFKLTRNLKIEASGFYQNFFNMQVPVPDANQFLGPGGLLSVGPAFTRIVNGQLAKIYGAQTEVTWNPTPGSLLTVNFTHLDPTFSRFTYTTSDGVFVNLSGNEVPRAPRNKVSAYGYYTFDLGKAGSLIPGGSVSYQDGYYVAPFKENQYFVPSHVIANFGVTYRTKKNNLDVLASVENAFRQIYVDDIPLGINGSTIPGTHVLGADRFYSLTARVRY